MFRDRPRRVVVVVVVRAGRSDSDCMPRRVPRPGRAELRPGWLLSFDGWLSLPPVTSYVSSRIARRN
jgi:hypothetical protein